MPSTNPTLSIIISVEIIAMIMYSSMSSTIVYTPMKITAAIGSIATATIQVRRVSKFSSVILYCSICQSDKML